MSGGAIVAKTVRNILAGSRQAANDRLFREQRAEAAEMGGLERDRLRQQIEAATLQDYTDPESGDTYKLPASEISAIYRARLSRRPAAAPRPLAPRNPPDLSPRLERLRKALDDRVEREVETEGQAQDQTWANSMRTRALQGDTTAFDHLGLPRSLVSLATGSAVPNMNKGLAPTAEQGYSLTTVVDQAIAKQLAVAKEKRRAAIRARYGPQYKAIEDAMLQSGGLTPAAPAGPAEPESDPLLEEVLRRFDEEEAAPEE